EQEAGRTCLSGFELNAVAATRDPNQGLESSGVPLVPHGAFLSPHEVMPGLRGATPLLVNQVLVSGIIVANPQRERDPNGEEFLEVQIAVPLPAELRTAYNRRSSVCAVDIPIRLVQEQS